MSVVGIIQARMGSARLPGKVLLDLVGHSMLGRVVAQLGAVDLVDQVVVATSDRENDDAIAAWCDEHGVASFRGDEDDVLDRYYRAARAFGADHVIRGTADNPLLDHIGAQEVVALHLKGGTAYTHNVAVLDSGMPIGTGIEVFTFAAIEQSWRNGTAPHHREHVDEYAIENPGLFPTATATARASVRAPDLRLTVDVSEDVDVVRAILGALDDPSPPVLLDDVVRLARARPELVTANRAVVQKEV